MRSNKFPQSILRFAGKIDHLLDVHHIVFDEINHISAGLLVCVIINRHNRIVLVPAPIFVPRQRVSKQAAMRHGCKLHMQIAEILIFPGYAAHIARRGRLHRNLTVLHGIGDFV